MRGDEDLIELIYEHEEIEGFIGDFRVGAAGRLS